MSKQVNQERYVPEEVAGLAMDLRREWGKIAETARPLKAHEQHNKRMIEGALNGLIRSWPALDPIVGDAVRP